MGTTIPRNIKGFDLYIRQTNAYLILGTPTNSSRYNWTAAFVTQWLTFLNQWTPLYLLYEDKKGGYTTDVKNDLLAIIENTVKYANEHKLIELIRATVGLTSKDCSTWNLPAKLVFPVGGGNTISNPNSESPLTDRINPTTEAVYIKLIPQAGGMVKCKCYTIAAESGRAHKLAGFDLVEYAVAVFYSGTANLPVLATDARLMYAHNSRASFVLSTVGLTNNLPALAAGAAATAKTMVIFFRWAKSKHPNLDGPWNGPFSTTLL